MDDQAFWTTLGKKWLEAREDVASLGKQLAEAQLQSQSYRKELEAYHRERSSRVPLHASSSTSAHLPSEDALEPALTKARHADNALEKARQEYGRLKEQVARYQAQIESLEAEKANILREKVAHARNEEDLRRDIARLQSDITSQQLHKLPPQNQNDIVQMLKTRLTSQAEEIKVLQRVVSVDEEIKQDLQANLDAARESLSKVKEDNKSLKQALATMQEMTRKIVKPMPHEQSSRRRFSPRSEASSVKGNLPKTLWVEAEIETNLPKARRDDLDSVPRVTPGRRSSKLFTREHLRVAMAGTLRESITRLSRKGQRIPEKPVIGFLCPGLDHNPWCPTHPGQPGFMFLGVNRERSFVESDTHHLFVGIKDEKARRKYRYLGTYRAVRVAPLASEEWEALDFEVMQAEHVKKNYATRAKEKIADSRTLAEMITAFSFDEFVVPVMRLQCVEFDESYYRTLVSYRPLDGETKGVAEKSAIITSS